jgi:hypothetical protein
MTQTEKPQFNRGGEGAVAASESGGNFARMEFLSALLKKPDSTVTLRFLTDAVGDDAWIYVKQHIFIKTKNGPADATNWPKVMPAVCRYDSAFAAMYKDCVICDMQLTDDFGGWKPKVRVWALACVREPVLATQEMIDKSQGTPDEIPQGKLGQRVGYTDGTRDVDEVDDKGEPTGKKRKEKQIVVVNQATQNFFGYLQGIASFHGTICDRDIVITRHGEKKDTDFRVVPLDRTDKLHPGAPGWERYTKAIEEQGLDIVTHLTKMSSNEYYGKFFDPRVTAPAEGNDAAAPPVTAPSNDVDADELASLRAQVAGRGKARPAEPVTTPDYE